MSRWIVCGVKPAKDECPTLRVAARMATTIGARLALVTVVPDVEDVEDAASHRSEGRRALSKAARKCRVPDDALHRVEFGTPADGLERVANDLRASFIVTGDTNRSALSRLLAPSVERQLVERSNRPIVVVPEGAAETFAHHSGLGGSIVCGVGAEDGAPLATFATALAGELGVRPVLVTATPGDAATAAGLEGGRIVQSGEPISTLKSVAEAEHACAFVVGTRRRNWLARLVRGSVSVRLVRTASRPVVVVPSGS